MPRRDRLKLYKLQSFYLNRQKMQSVQQFKEQTEMDSARQRIGIEPMHFAPKVLIDQIVIEDSFDFCQRAPSIQELPKFASTKIPTQSSQAREQFEASRQIFENVSHNINQNLMIYPERPQNESMTSLLIFITWVGYALGTSQSSVEINLFNLIDLVAMGIAFCLTFYNVVLCQRSIQFDHFLHLLGIILTIVLVLYEGAPGDSFPFILRILRSFRLCFILNVNFNFSDLFHIYWHKIYRGGKVLLPWIFITLLFSMVMHYSTYFQYYNRCSIVVQNSVVPSISQNYLCGAKACGNGSVCANPLSYDQIPQRALYNNNSQLSYGYFQYGTLLESYFTTISSAFLTNASKIISTFSDSSPILLIAVANLLLIVIAQLFASPVLLILIQQYFCQKLARNIEVNNENSSKYRASYISANGDLNSFLAPTFGANSSKSIQNKLKKLKDQSMDKNGEDASTPNNLGIAKSVKFINMESSKSDRQITHQSLEGCYTKLFQIVTMAFVILVGSAHFGLALAFVFGNFHEMEIRLIGVCLIVIFIVWSFWILLKLSGVTEEDDDKKVNKQLEANYRTIFFIQIGIYCVHLADYIVRIFIGGYILEEISPLTPLAASLLLVRILYLPIAFQNVVFSSETWKNLNRNIGIYKELLGNILTYFLFFIICSMILSTFSKQMNGLSYFYQSLKYFKVMLNVNWIEHFDYSSIQSGIDISDRWGVAIKLVLISIGQIFILKLIFADSIINSFYSFMKSKDITYDKITNQSLDEQARKDLIRKQKTFYLIPYDFLCIRSTIDALLSAENYRSGKQKIITIYVFALVIGECLFKDLSMFNYLILVGDMFVLSDACLTIIARRFWGEGSLVNNKWYNLINFIASVGIVANLATPLFDVFFLRVFRIFLLLQFYSQLSQAYNRITSTISEMSKMLTLFLSVWIVLTLMTAITFVNSSSSDIPNIILSAFNYSLRLMEKGFDLPSAIHFSPGTQVQFYTAYNSIIYLFVRIPVECILIGLGIAYFQRLKYDKEEEDLQKIALQAHHQSIGLTIKDNYELNQIKQKILSFAPKHSPIHDVQSNFLMKTLDEYGSIYDCLKTIIILIDISLLILVPLITQYLNSQQLLQVKLVRFTFYFLEVILFLFESLVYKAMNEQFKLKSILYILSFPGSLIMMIPMHKVQASSELANFLQFLLMLTPLPVIQVYYMAQRRIQRIVKFIFSRFNYTLWISVWFLTAVIFCSGVLTLIVNQSFLYLFSLVFIGFCGSTYEMTLEKNEIKNMVALYVVQICIFYMGLLLRSILIASFVFEGVEKISDYNRKAQNMEISRADFNKIFNEAKFISLWRKLDVKGIGMLPFKTVLNHMFHFAKCFNLHHMYIEYILKPKHLTFALKMDLFRRLHLPIRSVCLTQRQDESRSSEYMITLYDLIARFYCLALDENIHKIWVAKGMHEIKQFTHTFKNWSSKLCFDSDQWAKLVTQTLNALNYKRWVQEELEEKHFVPNVIETQSYALGSVLRIFPAIRTKVSSIKQKTK